MSILSFLCWAVVKLVEVVKLVKLVEVVELVELVKLVKLVELVELSRPGRSRQNLPQQGRPTARHLRFLEHIVEILPPSYLRWKSSKQWPHLAFHGPPLACDKPGQLVGRLDPKSVSTRPSFVPAPLSPVKRECIMVSFFRTFRIDGRLMDPDSSHIGLAFFCTCLCLTPFKHKPWLSVVQWRLRSLENNKIVQ